MQVLVAAMTDKKTPIIVDLLRHGEVAATSWAFRGSTDLPLSPKGWAQMAQVGEALEPADHIATSPLQRCHHFAEKLSQQQHCPLVTLDGMREMDFGRWENRSFAEISAEDDGTLERFWHSPVGIQPPEGEPFDLFAQRVIQSWEQWLDEHHGSKRLLIAHGGVIRVLLAHLLKMPMDALWRLHLPYASWSRVSLLQGEQPRLLFINGDACRKRTDG